MYSCLFPFMDGDSNLNLLSPSAFTTISSFTNVPYPTYFEQYIHEGKLWCIISVAFITPIGISIIALNKYWHRKKYVHKI
jgi:hypothetical protein